MNFMLNYLMQLLTAKERVISILKLDTIFLFSTYLLAFLIPTYFGKPQLLIGSIVNFLIAFTVFKYGLKKSIPVLVLPSTSTFLTGILFSGATPFILYLIPFIVISNLILAFVLSKKKSVLGVVLASILKAVFLFTVVNILMNLIGLPEVFLTSMGYIQLVTALIGSGVGLLAFSYRKRLSTKA